MKTWFSYRDQFRRHSFQKRKIHENIDYRWYWSDWCKFRSFVYPGDASRANKLDRFENVETVTGDLRSFDDVKRATEGVDAVVHLAAAFNGPFDNRQYLDINAMGTLNILECIREGLPKLHRLVYASTEAIYWKLSEHGRYFRETDHRGDGG